MTSVDEIRAASQYRAVVDAEFRALCLNAWAGGIPATRVADAAGVSRDTLYAWKRQAIDDAAAT